MVLGGMNSDIAGTNSGMTSSRYTEYRGYFYEVQRLTNTRASWTVFTPQMARLESGQVESSGRPPFTGQESDVILRARQSAKDYIDNYIDEMEKPLEPPVVDPPVVDPPPPVDPPLDDTETETETETEETGAVLNPDFILVGAIAFAVLISIFVFGDDE